MHTESVSGYRISNPQHLDMQELNFSNSTPTTPVPSGYIASGSVLIVCFLLGVPGNLAVIVWLVRWLKRNERSFTPRLMLNLAVSDLMIPLCQPPWIWSLLNGKSIGLFLCKFLSYVVYWAHYTSTMCVILLSIQRYVQVLHPQKWAKVGEKGQRLILSGIWVLSGIVSSYSLVQYTQKIINGKPMCDTDYRNITERVVTLLWEILMFLVALFLLAYFYFFLYRGVNQTAFFNNHALSKVLTRIVVTFFIFWIPYVINNILHITAVLLKNDSLLKIAETGNYMTRSLTLINSCLNPFLYAFSALQLRKQPAKEENL